MAQKPTRLGLTRDQLASFLNDFEQIKQFEKLFASVDQINNVSLDDISIAADNAGAAANEAQAGVDRLEDEVELTSLAPVTQNNTSESTDYIDFHTTAPIPAGKPGRLSWNPGDGTLDLGMGYDSVTQQIGLEQYYRIKADAAISDGQCIMFTGAVGASGVLKGAPATGVTDGQRIMGVATMDIANNGFGYVTSFGLVRGIDTTGSSVGETWADGDILYYNPAYVGGLTKVMPVAPLPKVVVAAVVKAGPGGSGSLFVRVQPEPNLQGLSDVYAPSPITNGQVLIGDGPQSRWEAATLTAGGNVTITNAPGSITISATDAFVGTVTSVNVSGGTTGLTTTGGPITTSGTITIGGTLNVANGGTGSTSLTSNYLLRGAGTSPVAASIIYDNGTNVGIGTTSPGAKFDVVGADIRVHNIKVGRGGGSISNNVAVGQSALNANTTGSNNTAVGNFAGVAITTGTRNTAIGSSAAEKAVALNGITAVGFGAAANFLSGELNTAVGDRALQGAAGGTSSGGNNTAIGALALSALTSGASNTAAGVAALNDVTTGGNNIAIGRNAGRGITTGSNNVIIGSVTGLSSSLANNIIIADGAGTIRLQFGSAGQLGIGGATYGSSGQVLTSQGAGSAPIWAVPDVGTVTGTLPVGNGGTGTATAFTAGSIVYAGASGVYAQDNATLNWDSTNKTLGVGRTAAGNVRAFFRGGSTGSGGFSIYAENSAPTAVFGVRDDGAFYTGAAALSPYNLTTAAAANLVVAADGYLYRSTSSARYKKNIVDYDRGLDAVMSLRPVYYEGKGEIDDGKKFAGFIAEEVYDSGLTEFVVLDEDGKPDALHYGNMTALLASAIKEIGQRLARIEAALEIKDGSDS